MYGGEGLCYIYCDNARLVPNTLGSHASFGTFTPSDTYPPSELAFCPPAPFSVLSFLPFYFRHCADNFNYGVFTIASTTSYPLDSLAPLLSIFQHPQHLQFFHHLSHNVPETWKSSHGCTGYLSHHFN